MSPSSTQKSVDTGHMLPPHEKRSGIGPIVGSIIVFLLLGFGALYFWGASMNRKQEQLPFIPPAPAGSTQQAE